MNAYQGDDQDWYSPDYVLGVVLAAIEDLDPPAKRLILQAALETLPARLVDEMHAYGVGSATAYNASDLIGAIARYQYDRTCRGGRYVSLVQAVEEITGGAPIHGDDVIVPGLHGGCITINCDREGWCSVALYDGGLATVYVQIPRDKVVDVVHYLKMNMPEGVDWCAWATQRLLDDGGESAR